MGPKPQFFANWKMNMSVQEARAFVGSFRPLFSKRSDGFADVGIAPPYTALAAVIEGFRDIPHVMVGSQNVHWLDSGAHTGEISAGMLLELGASFAIVGHSERRQFYGETDESVSKRAKHAIAKGLRAIVCVGESKEQYEAGQTDAVVESQLRGSLSGIGADETEKLIVAYEPVWAIGTGLAATPEIAARVHQRVRDWLEDIFGKDRGSTITILYGGSTKPENIAELTAQPHVNGALVGGASLKPDVFWKLVEEGRRGAA